jgi:hypothetical protein
MNPTDNTARYPQSNWIHPNDFIENWVQIWRDRSESLIKIDEMTYPRETTGAATQDPMKIEIGLEIPLIWQKE